MIGSKFNVDLFPLDKKLLSRSPFEQVFNWHLQEKNYFASSCQKNRPAFVGMLFLRTVSVKLPNTKMFATRGTIRNRQTALIIYLRESNHPDFIVRERLANIIKSQIQSTAEAIAIHLKNSPLRAHKQHVRSLNLHWPT